MTNRQDPQPNRLLLLSRRYALAIGSVVGIVVAWLVISLTLSVGMQVYEHYMRNRRVPKIPLIALDSPATVDDCRRRIEGFYAEFNKHTRDIHGAYKAQPALAKERWNDWFGNWQKTYDQLGSRYAFDSGVPEPTKSYQLMQQLYDKVGKTARDYNQHLHALFDYHDRIDPLITRELKIKP